MFPCISTIWNGATRWGSQGAEQAMSQQIVLDYIIANEDRHQGNFGAVRDAETLEFIVTAPVFDSGKIHITFHDGWKSNSICRSRKMKQYSRNRDGIQKAEKMQ